MHTQRSVNLHYDQVNAGRTRRVQRQAERLQGFLAGREEARSEYQCVLAFGFIGFAYTMLVTAVYLGYIL